MNELSYLADIVLFLAIGLTDTWPYLLLSVVSALLLGVIQGVVVARGHWPCRGAVLPVVAIVVWCAVFSASGLVGNLGALFVFGPSMVLWPLALCVGCIVGERRKGGREK